MRKIEEILKSKLKPKEKVSLLAGELTKDERSIDDLIAYFDTAPAGEQGHLVEAMEYASQDKPEIVAPYLDFVIEHLGDKAPRVKWECARIIANLAGQFADETERAIPYLLRNANDKSTVVRWSIALALSEIAKNNSKAAKTLLPKMKGLAENESNNGVKKNYLKALKV